MMKLTKFLPVLAISAVLLGGCSKKAKTSSNFDTAAIQEKIDSNINKKQYDRALGLSQALESSSNTKKNENQSKQIASLASAKRNYTKLHFSNALTNLHTAENLNAKVNNSKLKAAIAKLKSLVSKVKQNTSGLKNNYSAANQSLSAGKPAEAMTAVNLILQNKYDKPQYRAIYKKALQLKVKILTSQLNTQSTSTVKSTSTPSSNASTATSVNGNDETTSSDSSSSSSQGSITATDIKNARADLKASGENPAYWSDSDVTTAITNARKAGRTHIKASDLH